MRERSWWKRVDGVPSWMGPEATPRQKRAWDLAAIVLLISLGVFGLVIGSPYPVVGAVVMALFLGFNIWRFARG
jgi:hypothetical protein